MDGDAGHVREELADLFNPGRGLIRFFKSGTLLWGIGTRMPLSMEDLRLVVDLVLALGAAFLGGMAPSASGSPSSWLHPRRVLIRVPNTPCHRVLLHTSSGDREPRYQRRRRRWSHGALT